MTDVLRVSPHTPEPNLIARAADCLRAGGLVAFPTETVYGLGADALNRDAVRRVFAAKERPASDPLIVHLADWSQLTRVASSIPVLADILAVRFWPGPLTLVMPRGSAVPFEVTAGGDTVAVRIPSHPVAQALLRAAGLPIAAPSANLFSRPSPTCAAHVLQDLDGRVDIVLDGGATSVGVESTVFDLTTTPPRVLRPGAVTMEMLRSAIGELEELEDYGVIARRIAPENRDAPGAARSPGLLEKHYSPRAPLILYEGDAARRLNRMLTDARECSARGERVAALVGVADAGAFSDAGVAVISLGDLSDLPSVASRLYAALRDADALGADVILASGPDSVDGLGAALRDRLYRAAAGRVTSD